MAGAQSTGPKSIEGIYRQREPKSSTKKPPVRRLSKKRVIAISAIGLIILLALGAVAYTRFRQPPLTSTSSLQAVEARISKHYLLPSDEIPALATVTDKTKLSTPFFQSAKNGDRILLYQKYRIAIIYRPSIDRIVAVGPISIDTPPAAKNN